MIFGDPMQSSTKIEVVMKNAGGVLDVRTVTEGRSAKEVLIRMISECDEIYEGDIFEVNEIED